MTNIVKYYNPGPGNSGLTGTVGYTIYNSSGSISASRTTSGITELVNDSISTGVYVASITLPDSGGDIILWDCGAGINVTPDVMTPSSAVSGNVTVGGYAAGEDPATLVLGATASSWDTVGTIGAAINSTGGGFSGPDQVTFSFLSSTGTPIPYVQFAVVDVGLATTNAEGVITLGLNAGSYTVVAAPNSGVMWASQAFTVSGNTTVDVTGTAVPTPPTPTPTECPDIYGVITAKVISFPRPPVGCDMNWQIGDTQPLVSIILLDGNNKPINLANASTITIEYASAGLTTVVQSSSMYPSTDGIYCYYERAASDYTTENGGWYNARVIVGFAGDTGFSAPTVGNLKLFVGTPFVSAC